MQYIEYIQSGAGIIWIISELGNRIF